MALLFSPLARSLLFLFSIITLAVHFKPINKQNKYQKVTVRRSATPPGLPAPIDLRHAPQFLASFS